MYAGKALGDFGGDLLEDRRGEEEVPCLLGLLVEDFLRQELEQVTVGSGRDGLDEPAPLFRRRSFSQ
jgi:hypothetical protein